MPRLLSWMLALGLSAAVTAATAGGAEFHKMDAAGIKNYTQLDGAETFAGTSVGFGGATPPAAMGWLQGNGFKTVINLRLPDEEGEPVANEEAAARAAGLQYIHLPFDPENPTPGLVDEFLRVTGDPSSQPIYIHCGSGTRAAALWMIGRVIQDGVPMPEAEKEVTDIAGKPAEALAFSRAYLAADPAIKPD